MINPFKRFNGYVFDRMYEEEPLDETERLRDLLRKQGVLNREMIVTMQDFENQIKKLSYENLELKIRLKESERNG